MKYPGGTALRGSFLLLFYGGLLHPLDGYRIKDMKILSQKNYFFDVVTIDNYLPDNGAPEAAFILAAEGMI